MSDIVKRVLNGTFCALPFIHQHQGALRKNYLCCDSPVAIKNVFDSNSDHLRQQIWNGNPIAHCNNCYQLEQSGQISPRQEHTIRWLKDPEIKQQLSNWQPDQVPNIVSYDIRADNTCNLGCIMCWPGSSSLLAKELGVEASAPVVLNQSRMSTAKYVYLAGGEPLLINQCLELIAKISQQDQQPELVINTNLTSISDETFAQLSLVKNLTLVVSVDAFGDVNAYHRWPLVWSKFMRNLEQANEFVGKDKIMFNTVIDAVSVLNIGKLVSLENYATRWKVENLTMPDVLLLENLPNHIKAIAKEQLIQLQQAQSYKLDIAFKRTVDHAIIQLSKTGRPALLRDYINTIDQRRKINHQDYLGVNFNE